MARKRPEQALQIAVAKYLAYALRAPTYWTAIDHGAGKMTTAAAGLRKARGVKAGIPDIIVMDPGSHHKTLVVGIELKADKGALSEAQFDTIEALAKCNVVVRIARSIDEVEAILRDCLIPLYASSPSTQQERAASPGKFDQEVV